MLSVKLKYWYYKAKKEQNSEVCLLLIVKGVTTVGAEIKKKQELKEYIEK